MSAIGLGGFTATDLPIRADAAKTGDASQTQLREGNTGVWQLDALHTDSHPFRAVGAVNNFGLKVWRVGGKTRLRDERVSVQKPALEI